MCWSNELLVLCLILWSYFEAEQQHFPHLAELVVNTALINTNRSNMAICVGRNKYGFCLISLFISHQNSRPQCKSWISNVVRRNFVYERNIKILQLQLFIKTTVFRSVWLTSRAFGKVEWILSIAVCTYFFCTIYVAIPSAVMLSMSLLHRTKLLPVKVGVPLRIV